MQSKSTISYCIRLGILYLFLFSSLLGCQKIDMQPIVKIDLQVAYQQLKSRLSAQQISTLNWHAGQHNIFNKNDGTKYNLYIIASKKKDNYLIYADYKGHEVIRFIDLSSNTGLSTFAGNVVIRSETGAI